MKKIESEEILVSAFNNWSCGLACVESLATSNKLKFNQSDFIDNERTKYSRWATEPGLVSSGSAAKGIPFLEELVVSQRICSYVGHVSKKEDLIKELGDKNTVGIIITTKNFHQNGKLEKELAHAVRLLSANEKSLTVMNPYRDGKARSEERSWMEFDEWQAIGIVLKG